MLVPHGLTPPAACCSTPPQVLKRVHGAVMAALRAPPTTLPSGELVFQNWDVRHALAQERQQVRLRVGSPRSAAAVRRGSGHSANRRTCPARPDPDRRLGSCPMPHAAVAPTPALP